jgi:tetratricopeptide (TPR) repeat protein
MNRNETRSRRHLAVVGIAIVLLAAAHAGAGKLRSIRREASVAALSATDKGNAREQASHLRHSTADAQVTKWDAQVKATPRDTTAWVNLGDALMEKARETADIDYYNRAEVTYRKALGIAPDQIGALDGMAWVTSGRHEFEQSQAWAHKAIAINPGDNAAYGLLGDADVEMGKYDDAFTHYQKMLDLRPDISSYSRGAHLLYLAGDTRKALALMERAWTTGAPYAENTAWCAAQIATMLFAIGALQPAEQVANEAYKRCPNSYHVLIALGKIRAARQDYPGAIAAYEKAVEITPQHDALVALGDLYSLTGKPDEAKRRYDLVEAVYRMNKRLGMRGDWAMALFYANHDRNLPEALHLVQEEYRTRPNVAVEDALAWCLYKNGRVAEAREHAGRALRHGTPEPSYRFHAGMIAARCGDRVGAQKLLRESLDLNPHFDPVYASVAATALRQLDSGSDVLAVPASSSNRAEGGAR